MNITAKTKICMIIGDPVDHSLSPQMHNRAYEALGIQHKFIYVAARVNGMNLQKAIEGIRTLEISGISVTVPHKINVMDFLDEVDENAKKIGAVNTIINKNGKLKGFNTDYTGAMKALEEKTDLHGKNIAVIGAGGAARAIVFGLKQKKAKITVFNRTIATAEKLASEFSCDFDSLEKIASVKDMDIIINASTIGHENNESAVPAQYLSKNQIVFDIVYSPFETKLLKDAENKGATIIHGTQMLLFQAVGQFELFTGEKAPVDTMKKTLMESINL